MTNQDIINYVMETPCNSNPAVLNSLLNQLSGGTGPANVYVVPITLNLTEGTSYGDITVSVPYSTIKEHYDAGEVIVGYDADLDTSYQVYSRCDQGTKFYCEGCFGSKGRYYYIGYFSMTANEYASGVQGYQLPK